MTPDEETAVYLKVQDALAACGGPRDVLAVAFCILCDHAKEGGASAGQFVASLLPTVLSIWPAFDPQEMALAIADAVRRDAIEHLGRPLTDYEKTMLAQIDERLRPRRRRG